MDFILNEAEVDTNLQISDDEAEENNDDSSFIDNAPMEQESTNFYMGNR